VSNVDFEKKSANTNTLTKLSIKKLLFHIFAMIVTKDNKFLKTFFSDVTFCINNPFSVI